MQYSCPVSSAISKVLAPAELHLGATKARPNTLFGERDLGNLDILTYICQSDPTHERQEGPIDIRMLAKWLGHGA